MKKNLLCLWVAFLCMNANAGRLSEAQALDIARKYVSLPEAGKQSMQLQRQKSKAGRTVEPDGYYIFNVGDNNGFVIVSGDDNLTELVGYSDSGTIDANALPDGMEAMLESYQAYVDAVRDGSAAPQKRALSRVRSVRVRPLVKTKWNQSTPYNDLCPIYDEANGYRCPSGCVATAMAQVMNYWEWPASGVGSNTYTCDYGELSRDFSQSTYDWANMKDEYYSYYLYNEDIDGYELVKEWTDEEGAAVATLMYDCGVAVDMNYAPDGSGAGRQDAIDAFVSNFQYKGTLVSRTGLETSAFRSLIFTQLDNKCPVMFAGQGSGGGHAFVVDGYDSEGFVHVNWGWGGLSDGYFNMDYMNPDALGTGGGSGGYAWAQVIFLIEPDRDGSGNAPALPVVSYTDGDGRGCGIYASETAFEKNQRPVMTLYGVQNTSVSVFYGDLGSAVFDADGNCVVLPDDNLVVNIDGLLPGYYYSGIEVYGPDFSSLPDGTYCVYGVYKENNKDGAEWEKINGDYYLEIAVEESQVAVIPETHDLSLNRQIEGAVEVYVGQQQEYVVSVRNKGKRNANGSLEIRFVRKSDQAVMVTCLMNTIIYDNADYETEITVPIDASEFSAGETYVLQPVFVSFPGMEETPVESEFGDFEITVLEGTAPREPMTLSFYDAVGGGISLPVETFDKSEPQDVNLLGIVNYDREKTFEGGLNVFVCSLDDELALPFGNSCYSYQINPYTYDPSQLLKQATPDMSSLGDGIYKLVPYSIEITDDYVGDWTRFDHLSCVYIRIEGSLATVLVSEDLVSLASAIVAEDSAFELEANASFEATFRSHSEEGIVGYAEYEVVSASGIVETGRTEEFEILPYRETVVPIVLTLDASKYNVGTSYEIHITGFVSTGEVETIRYESEYDATPFMISVPAGLESAVLNGVRVYPNPTVGMVSVAGTSEVMSIDVYSAAGGLVKTETGRQVDLSGCPAGIYILSVNTGDGNFRCRVVKK